MAWTPKPPLSGAAPCDDDAPDCAENKPLPARFANQAVEDKSPAHWAYERLILYIQNFEEQLDGEHEVAMGFAGDEMGILRIEGIGFFDPDIVTFYGADSDGRKTQLIQHVSQLSVMLRALPREDGQAEPRRIGFRLAAGLDDGQTGRDSAGEIG